MTPEEFERIGNQACVSIAAGHDCMWQGDLLEPDLWEALRVELQRRYRRSTGETMAVLSIDNAPSPEPKMTGAYVHRVNALLKQAGVEINGDILHDCMARSALSAAPEADQP